MTTPHMSRYDSPASLHQLLQDRGLDGLDTIGKARLKHAMRKADARRGQWLTQGLQGLDEIGSLEELAELAELAGIGSRLKKAVKKVVNVHKKVIGKVRDVQKKVVKKVIGDSAYQKLKKVAPMALNFVPGVGPALAATASAGLAAKGYRDAKKKASAMEAEMAQIAKMEADYQAANASFNQSYANSFASSGQGTGQPIEGEYYAAGEPDPSQMQSGQTQWISGVENKWVMLGGGSLALLVVAMMLKGSKRNAS